MSNARNIASGAKFVDTAGDTMTGVLTLNNDIIANKHLRLYTTDDQANQWYVYNNTDDTLRFNYNGAGNDEVVINTDGIVTMPYQPSFYAYFTSGTQFAGSGSTQKLTNFTEYNDTGNCWDQTNQRFTAPVAGKYYFALTGSYTYTSGYFFPKLTTNGGTSAVAGAFHYPTQTTTYIPFTITLVIGLSANDYVEVMRDNNYALTMYNTNFSGFLIG